MIKSDRVLDRLSEEENCRGAFFTSYSFDPEFFENDVLRTVLRLNSHPVEQPERYHHEARQALQKTPVVAIVDAGRRQSGRRLPYDLLEVHDVVFHPKITVLLFQEFARMQIGSGNLTHPGYGYNKELFYCCDLSYADSADLDLVREIYGFIERIRDYVTYVGTQLDLLQSEISRHFREQTTERRHQKIALLDSTNGSILDQFLDLLPKRSVIKSVGMLAPFYEQDDISVGTHSVFKKVVSRTGDNINLDVGVSWHNPAIHRTVNQSMEEGIECLWTWQRKGEDRLSHLIPTSMGKKMLMYRDSHGRSHRHSLREISEAIEGGMLWIQPKPEAYAPPNTLRAAKRWYSKVRIWLHPASQLIEGRVVHQPLHAKLLILGFHDGRSVGTLVLMGSPNMSRPALLLPASRGIGNVEFGVAFRIDSEVTLNDFLPELVLAPSGSIELLDREFPSPSTNWSKAIATAIHDPHERTLRITWTEKAQEMTSWQLSYDGEIIAESEISPASPLTLSDFVLKAATADLILSVESVDYSVSILVSDLPALPPTPEGEEMQLNELILLLGNYIGIERALSLAHRKSTDRSQDNQTNSLSTEHFSPTNVFQAWWSVAQELQSSTLSVQGTRTMLLGAIGVGAAWSRMLDQIPTKSLSVAQVWLYGSELIRSLSTVELPQDVDRDAKAELISNFCTQVRSELSRLTFDDSTPNWLSDVFDFYDAQRL